MTALEEIRRRSRPMLAPLLGIAALFYLGFHAVQGDRGLLSWMRVNKQIALTKVRLAENSAKVAVLERNVALMRPDNLDRDMLDEQVRTLLLLTHPQELIIETQP